jgi:hypothetical protein
MVIELAMIDNFSFAAFFQHSSLQASRPSSRWRLDQVYANIYFTATKN